MSDDRNEITDQFQIGLSFNEIIESIVIMLCKLKTFAATFCKFWMHIK